MGDASTLLARLRTPHHSLSTQSFIMRDAADEIERLRRERSEARNNALEEALWAAVKVRDEWPETRQAALGDKIISAIRKLKEKAE